MQWSKKHIGKSLGVVPLMDECSFDRLWKAGHLGRGNRASKGMRWERAGSIQGMRGSMPWIMLYTTIFLQQNPGALKSH